MSKNRAPEERSSGDIPFGSHEGYETDTPLRAATRTLQRACGKRMDLKTEAPESPQRARAVVAKGVTINLSKSAVVSKDVALVPYRVCWQPRVPRVDEVLTDVTHTSMVKVESGSSVSSISRDEVPAMWKVDSNAN